MLLRGVVLTSLLLRLSDTLSAGWAAVEDGASLAVRNCRSQRASHASYVILLQRVCPSKPRARLYRTRKPGGRGRLWVFVRQPSPTQSGPQSGFREATSEGWTPTTSSVATSERLLSSAKRGVADVCAALPLFLRTRRPSAGSWAHSAGPAADPVLDAGAAARGSSRGSSARARGASRGSPAPASGADPEDEDSCVD